MGKITIRKGIFALIIVEAAVIGLVMIVSMTTLYRTYTGLICDETAEVLNLHTMIINSRISEMEKLSFEILSDKDIQRNLLRHKNAANSYEKFDASKSLYTQLFTRWATDKRLISISFVFEDGDQTETAGRLETAIPPGTKETLIRSAYEADGASGWTANAAGNMTVVLSRLIKDTSGNGFAPLGVLLICIDAKQLLAYPSVVPENRKPEMFCVAGDQILSESSLSVRRGDIEGSLRHPFVYDLVSYDGARYFVAVRFAESTGWYFAYILPTQKLLGAISYINLAYFLAMHAVLVGIVAMGYRFAKAISSPIARLAETMKDVADGDYSSGPAGSSKRPAIAEVELLSQDFSQMVRKIDLLVNEVYAEKLLGMEMKYKVLRQQINPHFLNNTLGTINWKAIENGNRDISVIVRALSRMLRGSITGPDAVTVADDLRFAESYIAIQKIRFSERLSFEASIQPEVLSCAIPRMTLQPIVENCIIHTMEKFSGMCEIRVHSSFTGESASILIADNGQGVDLRRMDLILGGREEASDGGKGLRNINERIKMRFGDRFGILVENREPTGTRVTVTIPFKEPSDGSEGRATFGGAVP